MKKILYSILNSFLSVVDYLYDNPGQLFAWIFIIFSIFYFYLLGGN